VSVFAGPYGTTSTSEASVNLVGGKQYEMKVAIDLVERKVTMSVAGCEVIHALPHAIDEIRYVGYQAIRTRSHFGPITAEMSEQE
jgi:hypothetical protein